MVRGVQVYMRKLFLVRWALDLFKGSGPDISLGFHDNYYYIKISNTEDIKVKDQNTLLDFGWVKEEEDWYLPITKHD